MRQWRTLNDPSVSDWEAADPGVLDHSFGLVEGAEHAVSQTSRASAFGFKISGSMVAEHGRAPAGEGAVSDPSGATPLARASSSSRAPMSGITMTKPFR